MVAILEGGRVVEEAEREEINQELDPVGIVCVPTVELK